MNITKEQWLKHQYRKILEDNYNYHKKQVEILIKSIEDIKDKIEEHEYQSEHYAVKREELLRNETENNKAKD
jgi:hypothetical protein